MNSKSNEREHGKESAEEDVHNNKNFTAKKNNSIFEQSLESNRERSLKLKNNK